MKSVLLLGLGRVAVGYDTVLPIPTKVTTHARAFSLHPYFSLVGGVDPNYDCRRRFEQTYKLPAYRDVSNALCHVTPDVVVVATPTALHLESINSVFSYCRPQAILCEKPLAYEFEQAYRISEACVKHSCSLYVNLFRHVEPGVSEIRARIIDGRIDTPLRGVVWYSKGMFNSGVHFLSLLQNLLGDVTSVNVLNRGRLWEDHDPEPDVQFSFGNSSVVFLAAREEYFFHNSIELIAPNGRLRYEAGGVRIIWQGLEESSRFPGYSQLCEIGESICTDFDRIQWYVVDELAAALEGRPTFLCSGEEALLTHRVFDTLMNIL